MTKNLGNVFRRPGESEGASCHSDGLITGNGADQCQCNSVVKLVYDSDCFLFVRCHISNVIPRFQEK